MKKTAISLALVLAMVLAMVLVPVPVAEAADTTNTEHTDGMNHCVCGATKVGDTWTGGANGIGNHTECTAASGTWTDLNVYYEENNGDEGTTNVTLPGGNYYLSGNLTVTSELRPTADTTITICLNGYDIAGDGKKVVFINAACTFNVCDCQGDGVVTSTCTQQGAVIFADKKQCTMNLFSGTIVGSNACTVAGGAVRMNGVNASDTFSAINLYNMVIKDGVVSGTGATNMGGNVVVNNCQLNMYGGIIQNGTAPVVGSNIALMNSAEFNMYGGAVIGGNKAPSVGIYNNSASAAIQLCGGFLQLNQNIDIAAAATKMTIDSTNPKATSPLVIDLNGKTLSGALTSITGKIGLADSKAAAGSKVTANVDIDGFGLANVNQVVASPAGRYITLEEGNNLSIHRIYVGFDKIRLTKDDDGKIGMNYVTNFKMDDEIKDLLVNDANDNAVYCKFGVGSVGNDPKGFAKDAFKADISTDIDAILGGQTDPAVAAATKICAQTFVNLEIDGQPVTIESNIYEYSLQDVIDALYAVENLESQNAAAAELLTFIKDEYGIKATDAA